MRFVRSPRRLRATLPTVLPLALALSGCPEDPLEPTGDDDTDLSPDTKAPNPPRVADIDVDVTHDGLIGAADEAVEDDGIAAFLANVDDDNGNGDRDRADINPDDDDLTPIVIRQVKDLGDARLLVRISPAIAQQRLRLYQDTRVVVDAATAQGEIEGIGNGDVTLKLEAQTGRTTDWDGRATITVELVDGDKTLSVDEVHLRAAPVIFPDNLQAPQHLYVMNVINDEGSNNQALIGAFNSLPEGVELTTTSDLQYDFDRWMQDNWEVGYQMIPVDGGVKTMITAMQHERSYGGQGLEGFVPFDWTSANRGFFYPGGVESSHNYGGNLEVAPPTPAFPFGRMLYGGGDTTLSGRSNPDTMNVNQVGFLNAQEIQGPAVELSSEWLAVGHIDEIFQFVPDLTPGDDGRAFKVVIASPALARDVLLSLQADGHGDEVLFPSRRDQYSVDEVLAAEQFMALNEAAQTRIDEVQAELMRELDLRDDDFRKVPVFVNEIDFGLVAAFNPGIQNLVTVGDRLFVPDPEGPRTAGVDRFQEATLNALADTDLDVIFVDVFESYHELLGEAHCGTNLERAPYDTPWWTAE